MNKKGRGKLFFPFSKENIFMNRKQYLREYYQRNKEHLSSLNKINLKKIH
jgi:hypothetical protein